MEEEIIHQLNELERKHQIKILYACEAGSRAYQLHGPDSDYDVRFIYVHQPEWYLSIDEGRDVLEVQVNKDLEISGWDLRKALKLFRKSNPPMFEWLHSGIVYKQDDHFLHKIKELEPIVFSPIPVLYHYLHMAKRNVRDYLEKEEVKVKKYIHVIRPILMCKWIKTYHAIPPIIFPALVDGLELPAEVQTEVEKLVQYKTTSTASDKVEQNPILQNFIKEEISLLEDYIETIEIKKLTITPQLNELFRSTLQSFEGK